MVQESKTDQLVDINSQESDDLGSTPMHLACKLPSLSIIQELLDTGAVDFRVLDNRLQLPSRYVTQSYLSSKKSVQMAEKRFFLQRLHDQFPDRNDPDLPSAGYYLYQKHEPVEVRSNISRKFSVQNFASRLKQSFHQPGAKAASSPEDPQDLPGKALLSTSVAKADAVLHSNGQRFVSRVKFERRVQAPLAETKDTVSRVKQCFIPKTLNPSSSRAERSVDENASSSKVPWSGLVVRRPNSKRSEVSDSSSVSKSRAIVLDSVLKKAAESVKSWVKRFSQQVALNLYSSCIKEGTLADIFFRLAKLRVLLADMLLRNRPKEIEVMTTLLQVQAALIAALLSLARARPGLSVLWTAAAMILIVYSKILWTVPLLRDSMQVNMHQLQAGLRKLQVRESVVFFLELPLTSKQKGVCLLKRGPFPRTNISQHVQARGLDSRANLVSVDGSSMDLSRGSSRVKIMRRNRSKDSVKINNRQP